MKGIRIFQKNRINKFYYDLTLSIKSGENITTVRVDNSLQPNTRFYSASGILRSIILHATGNEAGSLSSSLYLKPLSFGEGLG